MNPQVIENFALGFLGQLPIVDASEVRKVVRMYLTQYPIEGDLDNDQQTEEISRRVEEKLDLTMEDAAVVKLDFQSWLEGSRARTDYFYWRRYRNFLSQEGFPPKVLGTLDKDTDKITGLLENPLKNGGWKRRGLVVGHVQSGKTANYIGVISKAADHGYKFIVLLAGTQNNLRTQTQERLEEGFIGLDTDSSRLAGKAGAPPAWTGVGKLDKSRRPISITSRKDDFKTNIANAAGISFISVKEPIVLIIKKQKRVLENLINWLTTNNQASGGVIRNVPMLLIDDEADNASINTRAEDDPTIINRMIRSLLAKFDQNSYLGYTATPFANIFIDPDSQQEMLQEDLFPRDFIVSLEPPSDYVGSSRIFQEHGDLSGMIREVTDHIDILPERHKISHLVDDLPDSLYEAIRCFILGRAVRMLRGRPLDHSSMLLNVSRFNNLQLQVAALVSNYLTVLRQSIHGHSRLHQDLALADPTLKALFETWSKEFPGLKEEWGAVQRVLNEAIGPVCVRIINNRSSDVLNYKAHKEKGLHVIAVGGLSLSRGFTLEGLTVSYFLRNSIMYDTLLQMGRWFGYRRGYEDLCRLYMSTDAVNWYSHISDALDELRDEFRRMERMNCRPEDFGLKVRSHPDSLIVTARNKMRTGRKVTHSISLDGELIETVAVGGAESQWNWAGMEQLVSRLDRTTAIKSEPIPQGVLWRGVPAAFISDFLVRFRNQDDFSIKTQIQPVNRYIGLIESKGVTEWDVCLYGTPNGDGPDVKIGNQTIRMSQRTCLVESRTYRISGKAARVASRGAEKVGLSSDEISAAETEFQAMGEKRNLSNGKRYISDKYYRVQRKKPLLMLHPLQPLVEGGCEESRLFAWGMSFPRTGATVDLVEYVVNTTWWRERFSREADEEEEVGNA